LKNKKAGGKESNQLAEEAGRKFRLTDSYMCTLLSTVIFLGLFFDPEDGSDVFLQNVGWLSLDYMALYPRK
jgi:hypothetical protein